MMLESSTWLDIGYTTDTLLSMVKGSLLVCFNTTLMSQGGMI